MSVFSRLRRGKKQTEPQPEDGDGDGGFPVVLTITNIAFITKIHPDKKKTDDIIAHGYFDFDRRAIPQDVPIGAIPELGFPCAVTIIDLPLAFDDDGDPKFSLFGIQHGETVTNPGQLLSRHFIEVSLYPKEVKKLIELHEAKELRSLRFEGAVWGSNAKLTEKPKDMAAMMDACRNNKGLTAGYFLKIVSDPALPAR